MREGQQGTINESVTQSSRAGASLELDDTLRDFPTRTGCKTESHATLRICSDTLNSGDDTYCASTVLEYIFDCTKNHTQSNHCGTSNDF